MTDKQIAWAAVAAIVAVVAIFFASMRGQRHVDTEVHICDTINSAYRQSCHEIISGWEKIMKEGRP